MIPPELQPRLVLYLVFHRFHLPRGHRLSLPLLFFFLLTPLAHMDSPVINHIEIATHQARRTHTYYHTTVPSQPSPSNDRNRTPPSPSAPSLRGSHRPPVPSPSPSSPNEAAAHSTPSAPPTRAPPNLPPILVPDPNQIPVVNLLHHGWKSFWLRRLSHGQPVHFVCAQDIAEVVLLAELSSAIRARQPHIAANAATAHGGALDRVSCMKSLVKKLIQVMVDLHPAPATDNDAQQRIVQLELETQIAQLKHQEQQQTPPSEKPQPTVIDMLANSTTQSAPSRPVLTFTPADPPAAPPVGSLRVLPRSLFCSQMGRQFLRLNDHSG